MIITVMMTIVLVPKLTLINGDFMDDCDDDNDDDIVNKR